MSLATYIGESETGICDLGLKCCPHSRGGTIATGSEDVFIEGQKASRIDDIGNCNCPHAGTFKLVSGSSTVFINNRELVRIGDSTMCKVCGCRGSVVTGSRSIEVGG